MRKIGIVGLWHLGEIYSSCLAELGHAVIGIDPDVDVTAKLNRGIPPLKEPGLHELLSKNLKNKRLQFSSNFVELKKCQIVWLTIDTPIDKSDNANLKVVFSTLKEICKFLQNNTTIIVSSQLPVGTSSTIIKYLKDSLKTRRFNYAYVPENLRLGEAVDSFLNASRIVVGTDKSETYKLVCTLLKQINTRFFKMSASSAEIVKHATNAFLATSLSFIYDIADVCEVVGADIIDVSRALKADPRIGTKAYLDASVGFSGGTLGRDLQYLLKTARNNHQKLPVINAVLKKNSLRKNIVFDRLITKLISFKDKKICFYGITYKPGTSTLRRSLAIEIIKKMHKFGADITIYDPLAIEIEIMKILKYQNLLIAEDLYSAAQGCHAIVIITPWANLKLIDFGKLSRLMKLPKIIFDARNYLSSEQSSIKTNKLSYIGIGR